jgi:hypothetical protein
MAAFAAASMHAMHPCTTSAVQQKNSMKNEK